jgi:quinolinate synthase
LLIEFLKEHKKVQQLEVAVAQQRNHFEATISELKKEVAAVVGCSNEQGKQIQQVRTLVGLDKSGSRVVASKP